MSTDRELLELAAKAYGLQVKGWIGDRLSYFNPISDWSGVGDWNPLRDDGDALRLAAYLRLDICQCHNAVEVKPATNDAYLHEAVIAGDRMTATRRAIVRAAAEIGRAKGAS